MLSILEILSGRASGSKICRPTRRDFLRTTSAVAALCNPQLRLVSSLGNVTSASGSFVTSYRYPPGLLHSLRREMEYDAHMPFETLRKEPGFLCAFRFAASTWNRTRDSAYDVIASNPFTVQDEYDHLFGVMREPFSAARRLLLALKGLPKSVYSNSKGDKASPTEVISNARAEVEKSIQEARTEIIELRKKEKGHSGKVSLLNEANEQVMVGLTLGGLSSEVTGWQKTYKEMADKLEKERLQMKKELDENERRLASSQRKLMEITAAAHRCGLLSKTKVN